MDSKDELNTKLLRFRRETISPVDEEWLDHEASIVDEQCVLDELEVASDYDGTRASIVTKLKEWTGELVNVAGNKRILVQNIIIFFCDFLNAIFSKPPQAHKPLKTHTLGCPPT